MATLTCPRCGNWGDAGRSESAFDYVRRDGLMEIRRCRGCSAGLLVRFTLMPTEAHPEVIPDDLWRELASATALEEDRPGADSVPPKEA